MAEQQHQSAESRPMPELLYHYTSDKGLSGILESQCIWATHYSFLNDQEERKFGLRVYQDAIRREALTLYGSVEYADALVQYFQKRCFNVLDAFVVCFCTSFPISDYRERQPAEARRGGDRLSQWRGYGSGRQGYSLEFDSRLLLHIQQDPKNRGSSYYSPCRYFADSVDELVETHIRLDLRPLIEQIAPSQFPSLDLLSNMLRNSNEINQFLFDAILFCGTLKHQGFHEENEYRLLKIVRRAEQTVDFRDGLFDNTPYIKIPLALIGEDSPLRAIFVGPSAQMEQNAIGLRLRLQRMGLSHVEVIPSNIPYRNW